jgi:hypothetical protein
VLTVASLPDDSMFSQMIFLSKARIVLLNTRLAYPQHLACV